jgi:imidazolonepropionase-like amidohydrolase
MIVDPPGTQVTRLQGGGRTLMPGLIDVHTHIMFATLSPVETLTSDLAYVGIAGAKAAEEMLLRGFTSIRDMGGPAFGLKRGIDRGLAVGPRIWPSGAFISQTGDHGDFHLPTSARADPRAGFTPIRAKWHGTVNDEDRRAVCRAFLR